MKASPRPLCSPQGSQSDGWMSKRGGKNVKKVVVKPRTPSPPPSPTPAGQVRRGASGMWTHRPGLSWAAAAAASCSAKLLLTCWSVPIETFMASFY